MAVLVFNGMGFALLIGMLKDNKVRRKSFCMAEGDKSYVLYFFMFMFYLISCIV